MITLRSELSDLSDDDNAANKTEESRVLEGESSSDECNDEKHGNISKVYDEFSALKTKAFGKLLPFSTFYLCETGFSAVAALKTKYRPQLNIEKELSVSISNIKPSFEKLNSARQAHRSP
ncbi:zinc finger BED domain-containing protein 5 [Trichonephila clavipes]|uniref:Zinc finger BED domain-containing protein 5 n=1 Tax=Trichonephila clavipes TaxID=2585209 RepID=A0A8X7BH82_TRICX|nr:zinc finger BED domain-containing protein 5 [Trichonephila clavipes]